MCASLRNRSIVTMDAYSRRRGAPKLYFQRQAEMFATPSAIISAVVLLAAIVAIVCAAAAFAMSRPMSVNAMAIQELRMKGRLKTVKGADPDKALRDYLEAKSRLTHVDDASEFPPHPSINNMMGLTNEGNPWGLPSEIAERNMRNVTDATEATSLQVPQHQRSRVKVASHAVVNEYLGAVTGKKVKDRMFKMRKEVDDQALFESIFGASDVVHHRALVSVDGGSKSDIDLLAYHAGGHCSLPVQAVPGQPCSQTCFSSRAVRIKTPFVAGGVWVTSKEGEPGEYCWAENSAGWDETGDWGASPEGDRLLRPCSTTTAGLVLTDDGGWQCRPKYPTFFGGSDGTLKTACKFNPAVHKGPAEVYNRNVSYLDERSKQPINSHSDFANALFLLLVRSAKTIRRFKQISSDVDLLYNYPVVCDCGSQRDTLDNPLLDTTADRNRMKFTGMYQCVENPCFMIPNVSQDFGKFDASTGTCQPSKGAPDKTVNAVLGDERTPLVGQVPAMGLMVADHSKRPDNVLTQGEILNYDEATAKQIGRAAAPVVTAKKLDASNASRNVLYVPVPSIVLPANLATAVVKPSSVMHMDCLPPLLVKPSAASDRPFCTAPFYVEPAANVIAGHVPQKPYEHNMLVTECLRNSRMVSGNVHGGAEMLFSALLSHDRGGGRRSVAAPTVGDTRIDDIRDFFDRNFGNSRRLSTFEYLVRKEVFHGGFHNFSRWDKEFRRKDFAKTGINTVLESFVIREGLLMRTYGPYAATVLAPDSFCFKYMRGDPTADTPSAIKSLNPLQVTFPTSHSVLPKTNSRQDIFSTDSTRIFESGMIGSIFNPASLEAKLFSDDMPGLRHYRVDNDDHAWGLQTFRLDFNPHAGPAVSSDPRLSFDVTNIDTTPRGATLTPLSIFKKTPLEWGHPEADVQASDWFRTNIDTTNTYRRLFVETSMVLRNMWFSTAWENENYYYVKNSDQ